MGIIKNGVGYGDGFNIGGGFPIDSRMRVEYLNDLTTAATWSGTPTYQGMVVTVLYDGTSGKTALGHVYVLKDTDATNINNWVKLSTAADSEASADDVQSNLNQEIIDRKNADTVLSGAISTNASAITAVSGSVSTLTDNFGTAVSEFQAADTYLSGVTSGLVESLKSFKIKDVAAGDKMLAVDTNGKLSSTFNVSYDQDAHKIYFKGANDVSLGEVDASDFIADGMLSGATLVEEGDKTYIKFHFNTVGGGNDKISLDVTKLLNGTELHNLEASLSAHTASTTYHFTSDEKAKLTDLYTKAQLDAKFSENTEAHSNLSSDIAGVNTKVENILGNNTGYTGVTIPELNSGITANTKLIEDLETWAVGQVGELETSIQDIISDINGLTDAATSAHTTLQGNIDSANTRIDNVITAYTAADAAINDKLTALDNKVAENEEVTAAAIVDLQASKVSSIAVADEVSNIVVNEVKNDNGISYTIGFQWLTF